MRTNFFQLKDKKITSYLISPEAYAVKHLEQLSPSLKIFVEGRFSRTVRWARKNPFKKLERKDVCIY